MPKLACIPPFDEAAPKLRGGFGELCSFVASAPCLIACAVLSIAQRLIGSARVLEARRKVAARIGWVVVTGIPTIAFYANLIAELLEDAS